MKFFFHKDQEESRQLFDSISAACTGLIYISEIDAAVTPFAAQGTAAELPGIILQHTGRPTDDLVEEAVFADLFDRLTAFKDWHGTREIERTKKFLELRRLLEEHLTDLKVFRLGRIQIDIFAVGLDKNDLLMGVSTNAEET
jgi:hypothetical protein